MLIIVSPSGKILLQVKNLLMEIRFRHLILKLKIIRGINHFSKIERKIPLKIRKVSIRKNLIQRIQSLILLKSIKVSQKVSIQIPFFLKQRFKRKKVQAFRIHFLQIILHKMEVKRLTLLKQQLMDSLILSLLKCMIQ